MGIKSLFGFGQARDKPVRNYSNGEYSFNFGRSTSGKSVNEMTAMQTTAVYACVRIFLWAFEGLQRLAGNNFRFTESDRIRANREAVKRDNNNIFDFMDSEGYIRCKADASISSKDFYAVYRL